MNTILKHCPTIVLLLALTACNLPALEEATSQASPSQEETQTTLPEMYLLFISLKEGGGSRYITLDEGGDADTQVVTVGNTSNAARQTGNGQAVPAVDGNTTTDQYMQFDVTDTILRAGSPTPAVVVEIEYLDVGTDAFTLEYDAASGGPYLDGTFMPTRPVFKTDTGAFKTVAFMLKDIHFDNRINGGDLRIADLGDGAETIRKLSITLLPVPKVINVDSCGASPLDDLPDSQAIQACIGQAERGDTVTFTSGENSMGYKGYLIDKTIFLELIEIRQYLTFTSTRPENPALLRASPDLKGFVVKLQARSALQGDDEQIRFITISHLHLDGNQAERVCLGADGLDDGNGDNWGSWLTNECTVGGDPWCSPGTLDMTGGGSSNIVVDNVHITNTECATTLGMTGGHDNAIINSVIENGGDHVHASGCLSVDDDGDQLGDWSDGITLAGENLLVWNNTVVNASDVGIVFFGGRETVIRGNTVRTTEGNYGMFAGIAIHPWIVGDIAFGQVMDNTIINEANERCGGIHAGINLGTHMWGGGCGTGYASAVGNPSCRAESNPPEGMHCGDGVACEMWAHIPTGTTYAFTGNSVTGAHINYLVEGIDLQGTLIEMDNDSLSPRQTDWEAARYGCDGIYWQPSDKIAHHPSLPGWVDKRIHCER